MVNGVTLSNIGVTAHSSKYAIIGVNSGVNIGRVDVKRELKIHGVYRHFKGDSYIVEDVAIDSETGAKLVLYRALYGEGLLYARPIEMFLSEVDREKYPKVHQKYRFELIETESLNK